MNIVILMVIMALIFSVLFIVAFYWATKTGQFDDLDTPSLRMLIDSKKK